MTFLFRSHRKLHLMFIEITIVFGGNVANLQRIQTRRDRPKSAPYLRLKNSKRTSKCQNIGEFGTFYEKKFEKSLNS